MARESNKAVTSSEDIWADYPKFETDRLLIRNLTKEDITQIFKIRTSPIVNKYLERPITESIDNVRDFMAKVEKGCIQGQWYYWAICLKETPANLIGTICLWNFSEAGYEAEVGYELLPGYFGKGFMNESLKRVIEFADDRFKLKSIIAFTHKENLNSVRLLEKNNFIYSPNDVDKENENNIAFKRMRES